MIKTEKELKKDGWEQLNNILWKKDHKPMILFYNTETYKLSDIDFERFIEKEMSGYVNYCWQIRKKKFFDTFGEEEGMKMILIKLADNSTYDGNYCYSDLKRVYERQMIFTDPDYRKGMKVVVCVETEEILGKHFDNPISNLLNKGIITISPSVRYLRKNKLERINKTT